MKFVLFRHAHKGILPYDDPELSIQGFEQAVRISTLIKRQSLPLPTHLFVSPKIRTSQTFYPTSKEFNLKIELQPDLDQQSSRENRLDFKKRVQHFLQQTQFSEQADSVIFACTHYDWIEQSMTLINCDKDLNSFEFLHWSPAGHIVFEIQSNKWILINKGNV